MSSKWLWSVSSKKATYPCSSINSKGLWSVSSKKATYPCSSINSKVLWSVSSKKATYPCSSINSKGLWSVSSKKATYPCSSISSKGLWSVGSKKDTYPCSSISSKGLWSVSSKKATYHCYSINSKGLWSTAGSIPDSYDIYRYLNLVRYSIFDTRYFRRKCNFVDISRSYLKRLRHVHLLFFKKKILIKHSGENEIPVFLENPIFFHRKSDFFIENIRNSGGCPLLFTTFRKHRNPVFGHFPCFPASSFMPRVINIPSVFDTMWCKPRFILRTP